MGDEAKLENSDAICRSSVTCVRMVATHSWSTGLKWLAAVGMHAAQVLRGQLNRRQRILDFVRHLPGHFGPGFDAMRALELLALTLELGRHAVEVLDEPPQLVGRSSRRFRASRSPREMRRVARVEPVDRIGDALGHRVAQPAPARMNSSAPSSMRRLSVAICASISCCRDVQWDGQDRARCWPPTSSGVAATRYSADVPTRSCATADGHVLAAAPRGRRSAGVRVGSDPRQTDFVRSSPSVGAFEDIRVLVDEPAHPDHQVVVEADVELRLRDQILDDASCARTRCASPRAPRWSASRRPRSCA